MLRTFLTATFLLAATLAVHGQTSADAQLQQYVKELQTSPEDLKVRREIREKIIKLVATMPTRPPLPAEAEKHGFRAEYLAKSASTPEDFAKIADEYADAAMLAPWVAEYYQNWGIALDKSNSLEWAKDKFELYLIAAPNASDRADVRRKIAELELRMEQAAEAKKAEDAAAFQRQQQQAAAARVEEERQQKIARLEGRVWVYYNKSFGCNFEIHYVHGHLVGWSCCPPNAKCSQCPNKGDLCKAYETQEVDLEAGPLYLDRDNGVKWTFSLSNDLRTLTMDAIDPYFGNSRQVYQSKQ